MYERQILLLNKIDNYLSKSEVSGFSEAVLWSINLATTSGTYWDKRIFPTTKREIKYRGK